MTESRTALCALTRKNRAGSRFTNGKFDKWEVKLRQILTKILKNISTNSRRTLKYCATMHYGRSVPGEFIKSLDTF